MGDNSLDNVVVACHQCNIVKGHRTPEEAGMLLLEPGSVSNSWSQNGVNSGSQVPPAPPEDAFVLVSEVPKASSNGNHRVSKTDLQRQSLEVLEFLNRKAQRTFRPAPATLKPILARLNEGNSVEDCKVIIARKCLDWIGKDQEKYLRPKTLFAAENFQNYLGEERPHGR